MTKHLRILDSQNDYIMKSLTRRGIVAGLGVAISLAGCSGPATKQVLSSFVPSVPIGSASSTPSTANNTVSCVLPPDGSSKPTLYYPASLCVQYPIKSFSTNTLMTMTAEAADDEANNPTGNKLASVEWVASAVTDSQEKCQRFIQSFSEGQAVDNSGFDVVSIILSGLGAVLTPVNTVRALSAGSAAVQGTKAAINNDLFQQVTVLLLMQQINSTYTSDITKFADTLDASVSAGASKAYASTSLTDLTNLHHECSIPYALLKLGSSSTNNGTPSGNSSQPSNIDVTNLSGGAVVSYKGKSGTLYTVTVTAPAGGSKTYQLTTKLPNAAAGPAVTLAASLINNTLNLDAAQVQT